MPLRSLQAVAEPIEAAQTAIEVLAALDAVTNPILQVVGARSPGPDDRPSSLLVAPSMPASFKDGLQGRPPSIFARLSALNPPPFTFTEGMRRLQPSGEDRWIFDLYQSNGIRDGLYCSYGPWNLVYASDKPLAKVLTQDNRAALDAAALMAVHRLKELAGQAKFTTPSLSPREKSVLLHLSDGLSITQIADRLALAEASIKTFVHRAEKKLHANSQLHAVAIALRLRLI